MIEIPILNGSFLGRPSPKNQMAEEYCKIIRSIFFPTGVYNDTPNFTKIYPIGFLLFTNAHPEFRNFMKSPDTWSFLDSLTGDHFYIFSHKLENNTEILNEYQEKAMIDIFKKFDLGDIPINPYLVICDFELNHMRGEEPYEHTYDTRILSYVPLKIDNMQENLYLNAFRNSLGNALHEARSIPGWPDISNPANTLAEKINGAQFRYMSNRAIEELFRGNLSEIFAAVWILLSWRPNEIRV
jgi:hypothetical protein